MTALSIILLVLAGLSKAVKDRVMTGYSSSKFKRWGLNASWWDSQKSWTNKWKKDEKDRPLPGKERFPLSSTVLVWLTDAWHFFDLMFIISFGLGILLAPFGFFISIIITLAVFEAIYTLLKA